MQITEGDFKKIAEYFRDVLVKQCIPAKYENDYPAEVVPKAVLLSLPQLANLTDFLEVSGEKKERAKAQPIEDDKGFETFWLTYPATPTFKHRGRTFTDSRTLRSNKAVCRRKYLEYLHDNPTVTPEFMLKALQIQLKMAKDESVEEGKNRLARWNGLEVYLNQGKFEPFLEMAASGEEYLRDDDSDYTGSNKEDYSSNSA